MGHDMSEEYAIPVVSLMGNDGLCEDIMTAVASELGTRGMRAGIVRYSCDDEQCGSAAVEALVGDSTIGIVQSIETRPSIMEVVDQYFTLCDVVLTTGCVKSGVARIYVGGADVPEGDDDFLACADGTADAPGLADEIAAKFFSKEMSRSELRVWVNGKFLVVKPFVKAFIGQAVKGMLSSLRGGKDAEKIHIKIGR